MRETRSRLFACQYFGGMGFSVETGLARLVAPSAEMESDSEVPSVASFVVILVLGTDALSDGSGGCLNVSTGDARFEPARFEVGGFDDVVTAGAVSVAADASDMVVSSLESADMVTVEPGPELELVAAADCGCVAADARQCTSGEYCVDASTMRGLAGFVVVVVGGVIDCADRKCDKCRTLGDDEGYFCGVEEDRVAPCPS